MVDKTSVGEEDDVVTAGYQGAVNLRWPSQEFELG